MTEPEMVTCARCGETGELSPTNDYYTTWMVEGNGRVCEACLLILGGLDPATPVQKIDLTDVAEELARERGAISIHELIMLKEAIDSRRLDEGDGETWSVT